MKTCFLCATRRSAPCFDPFLITLTALLHACKAIPADSPETGYSIHGYVGESAQAPAPGVTVLLLDGSSGRALATDQADFMGKYQFPGLKPGHCA